MKLTQLLTLLLISLIVLICPIFLHGNEYVMHLLIMSMIWAVVASAWDLILAYGGIFNLAQVGFFAIGSYTSAMMTMQLGISPWLGLLMGGIVTAIAGVLVGLPCLRLHGIFIALMTLAFFEVIGPLISAGRAIGTGGRGGLLPIHPLSIGNYVFSSDEPLPWYFVAFVFFAVFLFVIYKVINSKLGLAFTALRDSESFAQSLGVNRYKCSLIVTGIATFITGVMGAFYAHYVSVISPRMLGLDIFLILIIMIIVGGAGRFPGAVIGSFAITFFNDSLRPLEHYRMLVFGVILVTMIRLAPKGIMGYFEPVLQAIATKSRIQKIERIVKKEPYNLPQ